MTFMSDLQAVFLGNKSSSKKHPQTSSEQIERQRAPFQNINSSLNAGPQVAPKHKPALPAMSYRAAPVLSPAKEQYERRFHTSPVKVTAPVGYQPPTYQQSAQQLSDFGGPMDEQIMGLHDRRGKLNPTAVQAFVDRQIQGCLGEAYAQMGAMMYQADMDADAVYQATLWRPASAHHSNVPYQTGGNASVEPHQAAYMPATSYPGGSSVAPFGCTASAPPLAASTPASGKAVFAM